MASQPCTVEELKERGNKCVKEDNFAEAIIHYSEAIKLAPGNAVLYSNRSYAFLKMEQIYLAHEDASKVIRLCPDWPKGYFRKGEAESKAEHFEKALMSYQMGLVYAGHDQHLKQAILKSKQGLVQQSQSDRRLPWIGVSCGLFISFFIILADHLTDKPTIPYTIVQAIFLVVFGALGYGAAFLYRNIVKSQREALLQKPIDLLEKMDHSNIERENGDQRQSVHRTGRSLSGKQRYRKGKTL